jgi:hypothetical protein
VLWAFIGREVYHVIVRIGIVWFGNFTLNMNSLIFTDIHIHHVIHINVTIIDFCLRNVIPKLKSTCMLISYKIHLTLNHVDGTYFLRIGTK